MMQYIYDIYTYIYKSWVPNLKVCTRCLYVMYDTYDKYIGVIYYDDTLRILFIQ